ncbi:tRNA modification GTPase GTPBP3 [Ascosphaera apis ARSEF 7405]|uniref:tRNA modification GTPase GTPBP3 n=1 Tax=Ascosphaera apis ARSEF 7405 TaxID=392613 RepID=A0A167XIQ8_9EURO|nr:tRNA modification GTPase GTPBP3 [Ascosphaera apis ARSEF 7405]
MIRTFGLVASRWGAKTLFHRAPAHLRASCLIPSQWERASLKNSPRYLASLSQNLVRPPVQSEDSTIFALSTAPGKSAIAIIRISGPHCKQIYQSLCPGRPFPKPRYATLRSLHEPGRPPSESTALDSGALVLYFPAPQTVTGEDLLELHVHGGPAIVKAVLGAIPKCVEQSGSGQRTELSSLPSISPIRYAEAGEFTRRAFLNNRLDIPQIEALGETLDAETEQQRQLAVQGTVSSLSSRYEAWRQQLLEARGELEALIDFSEDQHFDESIGDFVVSIGTQIRRLLQQINLHVENAAKGELMRNGIKIALLGAPNAGKSSLLNQIVGREAAIVSNEQGTQGISLIFGDMAGLRSASGGAGRIVGAIETEGIRRAKARALESDVVIVVLSLEDAPDGHTASIFLEPEVIEATQTCLDQGKNMLVVVNKIDKAATSSDVREQCIQAVREKLPDIQRSDILFISCEEAQTRMMEESDPGNIQTFLGALQQLFKRMAAPSRLPTDYDAHIGNSYYTESLGVTYRQKANLELCAESLRLFLDQIPQAAGGIHDASIENGDVDIVMAAENLRQAADCLSKITGRGDSGDVEEVLGVVFEKFCVGK